MIAYSLIGRSVRIRQRDVTDCGAARLASITSFYKLKIPVSRIRQLASTDRRGTNVAGMIDAAENLGFQAKGVRGDANSLDKIPLPSIAHVRKPTGAYHYVVIYKVRKGVVSIMDPSDGKFHKKPLTLFLEEWTGVLIILLPSEKFETNIKHLSKFRRFLFLLLPHWSVLIQALFGALIQALLGLAVSIYIQKITDHVLPSYNRNLLNLLGFIMISLLLFKTFIGYKKSIMIFSTGQRIDAQLLMAYFKHLFSLPQQFFDTMRTGEILSRVNDAVKIRVFLNDIAVGLLVNVMTILFSLLLMFTYFSSLAFIVFCIFPIYFFVFFIINRINSSQSRKVMEHSADFESYLVESISASRTMRHFSLEGFTIAAIENRFVGLLSALKRSGFTLISGFSISDFLAGAFTILVLWFGSFYVIDGKISPGELLSFYTLVGYTTGPILAIVQSSKSVQDALIAADRLFEILDLDSDEEHEVVLPKDIVCGDIRFEDVVFRYNTKQPIFDHISVTIKKGQTTAIVGESGSGKSTFLALLQAIYPLRSGGIFLAGQDIKHLDKSELRRIISVVPQNVELFSGSIASNIAIGDCNPNMSKVLQICKDLGMISFIENLPDGFHTRLGENGINLSGGQRQRLAIARALYHNPEILILDEPTSSLDAISEDFVRDAMRRFVEVGKTVVWVAHRISTIKHTDHIFLLHQGRVIEEGNHRSLIENAGFYYELWRRQTDG